MLTSRLSPKQVAAEMNCSVATARARMRQMIHTENPLTVTEEEVARWWEERTRGPVPKTKHTVRPYCRHMKPEDGQKFLIPRKRLSPYFTE